MTTPREVVGHPAADAHEFRIRVRYPAGDARVVLRTELDWERDVAPARVSTDRTTHEFLVRGATPFLYFKPRLLSRHEEAWSQGANFLATAAALAREVYPHFAADAHCSECALFEIDDNAGRRHRVRAFYPPGYWENTLRRYPVLYMQDGQNLFFPGEACGGTHWRVAETLRTLDAMNAATPVVAVGIYPCERETDYTHPGYAAYARFVVGTLKPWIDRTYRTLPAARHTGAIGSSLGGVAALHLAWSHPEVFGMAACLSSTFGWRDDLRERIASGSKPPIRVYLDSGWPQDNYEATRDLRALLVARGFREGVDLHYLAYPGARHDEAAWATRLHVPVQLLYGAPATESLMAAAMPSTALRLPAVARELALGAHP
jgi:enterochelin esterase-like enzyme